MKPTKRAVTPADLLKQLNALGRQAQTIQGAVHRTGDMVGIEHVDHAIYYLVDAANWMKISFSQDYAADAVQIGLPLTRAIQRLTELGDQTKDFSVQAAVHRLIPALTQYRDRVHQIYQQERIKR